MRRARTGVWVTIGLLVLAAAALVVQRLRRDAARAAEVAQLIEDVDTEVQKDKPDGSELGRLKLRLEKLPERATDRRLTLAMARIERARGRDNAAWELMAAHAAVGDASLAELRLGADLLLRLHARNGDRAQARQARDLALRAYGQSHQPEDLLLAALAAHRTGSAEEEAESSAQLHSQHADSKEARLCDLISKPPDAKFAAEVQALQAAFGEEPIELGVAAGIMLLQQEDPIGARAQLDQVASRAPALLDVRYWSGIACQAVAASTQLSDEERQRAVVQRDAHLHYCLEHGIDEARRATCERILGR